MPKKKMYRRPDGLYEKIITVHGKRKAFRGRTEKEVFQKILEYQGETERGRLFSAVAEEWKADHWGSIAYNTTKGYAPAYRRAIERFGDMPVKDIKASVINSFIVAFSKKGYAQKTVRTQLLLLHLILSHAVICGDIEYNPASNVNIPKNLPKKKRELPNDADIETVKRSVGCTFGLFAYFLLYTGCRKGEALAIQYGDIHWDDKTIIISKSVYHDNNRPRIKRPKTEAGSREILLLDNLAEQLPKGKKDHYLFSPDGITPYTETQFQRQWELYCKEAGLSITPHQLRHAYATMLFEAGIDEKDAQELLGHSSITMTRDIYTHIRKVRNDSTAKLLNAYISK